MFLARQKWAWALAALLISTGTGYTLTHPAQAFVRVVNATRPTQCAEEDNVYVKLQGESLRRLRVEARHPRYMSRVSVDSYAPDFSNCKFDENAHPTDPKYEFTPKRVILWESDKYLLVGNTHETFWRPNRVDFTVQGHTTPELHLVQMYLKDAAEPKLGRHQFLVLYPPDGYWRAKPLPTLPLNYGVYGASFLVGPVEEAGRPVVEIEHVEFVPQTLSFRLAYRDGSHGEMRVAELDRQHVALEYTHDRDLPAAQPLAAIRSMYVEPVKSDTAEVSWRGEQAARLQTSSIAAFKTASAVEVSFGRSSLSKHNASAPDMWFGGFGR
ncbi:MAG TPA: hypothetical protein VJR89_05410 [Polyangiales bacterium]|nr:hypothetical protein [Polyangiales bacterium]